MSDTPENELSPSVIKMILDPLIQLAQSPRVTELPSDDLRNDPLYMSFYRNLSEVRTALLAMANEGNLSTPVEQKGVMAGALKALQANLRHLTWQTQMIASGDYTQRVDFMGQFSEAFNSMVSQLEIARSKLAARNEELQREVEERQRAETAEREQRMLAEALQYTGQALTTTLRLDREMERITELMRTVVPFDCGCLLIAERGKATVVSIVCGEECAAGDPVVIEEKATLCELSDSHDAILLDPERVARDLGLAGCRPLASCIGVALHGQEGALGFLLAGKTEPDAYDEKHAQHLSAYARQVALAIQNAQLYEEINRLATTDQLTGLFNRRHFFSLAIPEAERSIRVGTPIAVLLLDIDHFKQVNDTYGHLVGDGVLQQVAKRCMGQVRMYDILARYGGEEFVALLPHTDEQGAAQVAERLRARIEQEPIECGEWRIPITVSIGMSCLEPSGITWTRQQQTIIPDLIDRADRALYAAKRAGRNRVVQWDVTP